MSSDELSNSGSDGQLQRRSSITLVKERNDTNLEDPYETVSTNTHHTHEQPHPSLLSLLTVHPLTRLLYLSRLTVSRQAFQRAGWDVSFLPALEFVFVNQQRLLDHISQPLSYSALVATSPRGAAAAITALTTLAASSTQLVHEWQARPFYVVGDGSAAVIARSTLSLPVRAIGGNAERLGAALVADYSQPATGQPTRLLVLSGNLRRQELFNALTAAHVPYDELTVYETRTNRHMHEQWQHAADTAAVDGWVAYFSPSGVQAVRQCVEEARAGEGGLGGARCARWLGLRVAALGKTSASAVREVGWTVYAVAESPAPAQLLAAMQSTAQQQRQKVGSECNGTPPLGAS